MSVPGVPRLNYRVKATLNTLEFWWQPPINDGGRIITGYNLLCSSIPYSTIINGSTFYAKVSSLTNSTDYVFQLAAINAIGTGPFTSYQYAQPGISSQTGISNLTVASNSPTTAMVSWAFSNGINEATNKYFAITVYPSSPTATMSTFRVAAYPNQRSALISGLSTNYYTFLVQPINDSGWYFPNVSTLTLITAPSIISIVPGIQVWLDGKDPLATGLPPTNNTTLTSWSDKSGNSNNATAVGTPKFTTSGVEFNGTNSAYTTTYSANNPQETLFVVVNITNTAKQNDLIGPGVAGDREFFVNNGTVSITTGGAGSFFLSNGGTVSNGQTNLLGLTRTTTNINFYTNGSLIGSNVGSYITTGNGNTTIGAYYSGAGNLLSGTISEIIIYRRILTDTERQTMEGYLAWKWSLQDKLPVGHPYKNNTPF
jgi:hypothetical protein